MLFSVFKFRSTGNFNKNAKNKVDQTMCSYGNSVTDTDHLCVPNGMRNVRTAPSTPEMESKPFPRTESASELEMHSTKRQNSKSPSPDLQSGRKSPKERTLRRRKSRNEKFHRLFKNIPLAESAINHFSCAYFGDILLQGYLYISTHHFCFYSKILGKEKLIEIPVSKVLKITREKTAFIIPNAIGVATETEKYVFGSLISRDSTLRLMVHVWKKQDAAEISSLSAKEELESEPETTTTVASLDTNSIGSSSVSNNVRVKPTIELTLDSSGDSSSLDSMNYSACSSCSRCGHPESVSAQDTYSGKICQNTQENHALLAQSKNKPCRRKHKEKVTHQKSNIQCFDNSKTYKTMHELVTKVQRMPRTSLLLAICSVLVLFLTASAVMMLYKILMLQAQLDKGFLWRSEDSSINRIKMFSDVYFLKNQYHAATIERFHSVIQANLQVLNQVHNSLKNLESSPLSEKSCMSSPITQDDGT